MEPLAKQTPPPPHQYVIYVGYQLQDEHLREKLMPVFGERVKLFMPEAMVAHMYYRDANITQAQMETWYRRGASGKQTGYLRGYFIRESSNNLTVVGDVTIGSQQYYLLMASTTKMKPFNIRLQAIRGEFGAKVELAEKIPLEFIKCIHRDSLDPWDARGIRRF